MAVAAYASVLSLLRVVDSIQHPSRLRLFPKGTATQIDALRDKLSFLQDFLELHSSKMMTKEDIDGLVIRKIPRVTCDAEILIDNYVVDKLYRELYPQDDVVGPSIIGSSFDDGLLRAIREVESVNEALSKLSTIQRDQERTIRVQQLDKFTGDEPLKNKVVGFDDQLKRVLEKLTGNQRNLVIVPIVGMGGIGKTTLARSVFDHPYNSDRFHVRIWLTISQDYSLKRVLQGLLADGVLEDEKDKDEKDLADEKDRGSDVTESELIIRLHQKLFGQRYLIVMDDVWSSEAWDDLRRGFPDNENGSRVVVTTRSYDIASCVDSQNNNTYSMEFLDEDQSWDLFVQKVIEKGGRISLELEEIGRDISRRCEGLPILLASVGGLLAISNMTVEYWQSVEKDMNSVKVHPQNVPMLTTYRSIDLSVYGGRRMFIFHTIRLIWNLEILDIYQQYDDVVLPKELWEMPQLRHVKASSFTIPNPAASTEHDVIVLENLQTFAEFKNFDFTEDVVRRIPNLRHLEVSYDVSEDDGVDLSCFHLQNISRLQKLERLSVDCAAVPPMDMNAVSLPCSLKILLLDGCKISWDKFMTIAGSSLPNLEELILWGNSVVGEQWDLTIEGSGESFFPSLKYLTLSYLNNLERWRVDDGATQFPALETIRLNEMRALEEIPREIGEQPSLNWIHLSFCSVKVVDSAKAIAEEQWCNGNEMFMITVRESAERYYQLGGANRA